MKKKKKKEYKMIWRVSEKNLVKYEWSVCVYIFRLNNKTWTSNKWNVSKTKIHKWEFLRMVRRNGKTLDFYHLHYNYCYYNNI